MGDPDVILLPRPRSLPQTGDPDVICSERDDRDSTFETSNAAKLRQFKMTNTADSEHATVRGGNVDSINAVLRVPPFWPDDVELWFTMLEVQFATARIRKNSRPLFHTSISRTRD